MKKLVIAASLAALILTSWTSTATAQAPPGGVQPVAETAAPRVISKRDKGLMLRLGLGLDGCTDDWCDNVDPSVNVRFVALYRVMKYFSAGLHMAFLFGDPDHSYADRVWNLFIGAEGRGMFPYGQFDFWVAVALGYNRTMGKGDICVPMLGCAEGHSWMNAFALGFGFGADYFITKNMAVGLAFYLYKPWPDEICGEINNSRDCSEMTQDDLDNIGIIWSINAMFTFFLPM